jgi:nucleotide-binding universal stress UspA family protein
MHRQLAAGEASAGPALLQAASNQDAALLVMGADTRRRVAAPFLGEVSGHVLRNPPPIPVLMGR